MDTPHSFFFLHHTLDRAEREVTDRIKIEKQIVEHCVMWLKSAEYPIVYMFHFFNHSHVEDEEWTLRGKEKKGRIEKVASTWKLPRVKQTASGKPGSSPGAL